MTDKPEAVEVTPEDYEWAVKADDGAIAVARALSSRDCGALQSEMRDARKQYLAELFAAHRLASPNLTQQDRSRTAAFPNSAGNSELEPDDERQRNRDADRQGGEGRQVGGCAEVLSGGMQRSERAVLGQDGSEHEVSEGGAGITTCATTPAPDAVERALKWIDHNLAESLMKSSVKAGNGHDNFAAHEAHHALKTAKAALSTLPNADAGPVARVRHKKRGTFYDVIGSAIAQGTMNDYDPVAVYRGDDGQLWVRPYPEFTDGRFEEVPYAAPTPPAGGEGLVKRLTSTPIIEALTPSNDAWQRCETVQDTYDLMKRLIRQALSRSEGTAE